MRHLTLFSDDWDEWEGIESADPRIPYGGRFKGKQGLRDFSKKYNDVFELVSLTPIKIIVMGDQLASFLDLHVRNKSTGKEYHATEMHDVVMHNGKALFFRVYNDSLRMCETRQEGIVEVFS